MHHFAKEAEVSKIPSNLIQTDQQLFYNWLIPGCGVCLTCHDLQVRRSVHGSLVHALGSDRQDLDQDLPKVHPGGDQGEIRRHVQPILHPFIQSLFHSYYITIASNSLGLLSRVHQSFNLLRKFPEFFKLCFMQSNWLLNIFQPIRML